MNRIILPRAIEEYLKDMNCMEDTIGCSEASVQCFTDNKRTVYLKIEKTNQEISHEIEMLEWIKDRLPAPRIIESCREGEYEYLLMTKAVGQMACSEQYLKNPEKLVENLARGIKLLQSVDISTCPFDCRIERKLKKALERIETNKIDMEDWEGNTRFKSPQELYNYLLENKPEEELVFTHGDYCFPNIFFNEEGVSGFIDLGRAGVGDKWQDIALCVRSLEHKFENKKYIVDLLFKHLGFEPNYDKISYYILLDELF